VGEAAFWRLIGGGWISKDALLVFELGADETPECAGYDVLETRIYGAAKVLFLKPVSQCGSAPAE
jgi:16S rRNA (guanine966-N2)-methyltransferase